MHLFSFLFRIFADNMQILLASAKIMNDKVSVLPDVTLSIPAFRKEAESFDVTAGRFLCYTSLVSKWGLDNLWQSRGILTPA